NKKDYLAALLPGAVLKQHGRGINGIVQSLGGLAFDGDQGGVVHGSAGSRGAVDCGAPKRISLGCNGRGGLGRDVLAAQFGDELVLIACEAVTFMKILVKGANESLVAGAHPPNECAQAGLDLVSVLAFQVVVNQDDHGDRIGFGGKRGDLLLDIV